jgi:hypothetical protein
MLSALVAVWLGIAGPIDLSRLKEWQTLLAAIIAPSIAFGAAIVAYNAAMAKVSFDRKVHEETVQRQWRGLLLRLRFALEHFIKHGEALSDMVKLQAGTAGEITVTAKMLVMTSTPFELEEAWKDLGLFDESLAKEIAEIKTQCREIEFINAQWSTDREWTFTLPDLPKDLLLMNELTHKLERQCKIVVESLKSRIAASSLSSLPDSLSRSGIPANLGRHPRSRRNSDALTDPPSIK